MAEITDLDEWSSVTAYGRNFAIFCHFRGYFSLWVRLFLFTSLPLTSASEACVHWIILRVLEWSRVVRGVLVLWWPLVLPGSTSKSLALAQESVLCLYADLWCAKGISVFCQWARSFSPTWYPERASREDTEETGSSRSTRFHILSKFSISQFSSTNVPLH